MRRIPEPLYINNDAKPVDAKKNLRAVSDMVGIGLSLLCLVHCLALPVLIAFAPAILRGLPGDDITHRSLAVLIGFVGFLAFRSGYKVHRRRWVLGAFITGLLLVSIAAVLGDEVLTGYRESAVTVCGGLLLVTAHLVNHSFCRSCLVRGCGPACTSNAEEMISTASADCKPL
jgi:peptidoglycan/LPS O-acetylase OafA/YrhL